MANDKLDQLRTRVDELNLELLRLINERARLVQEIGQIKENQGVFRYDPVRERTMLDTIKEKNDGQFENSTIDHIFKEIFKAS
jgi:3-deoxy-7-phosphoheptulonate synthase / chorismate mutase